MSDAKHTAEPLAYSVNCPSEHEYDIMIFTSLVEAKQAAEMFNADCPFGESPHVVTPLYATNKPDSMADPAAEIAELRAKEKHLRLWISRLLDERENMETWIAGQHVHSDFQNAGQMRAEIDRLRKAVAAGDRLAEAAGKLIYQTGRIGEPLKPLYDAVEQYRKERAS